MLQFQLCSYQTTHAASMLIDQQQKPSETLHTKIFRSITQIKLIATTLGQRFSSHYTFHMKPT